MSQERFTREDFRVILLAVLVGILGVVVALRYYFAAFPEASIEFTVSRPEIEQRARIFLQQRGFDLTPFRQLILFRHDDTAKTFLERELGLAEANRLMAAEINVWRWKVRFFRPPEKEELIVWLDPSGKVVGFEHVLEEEAPGARLEKPQARSLAEVFLHTQLGLALDDYTLVEDAIEERPNRLDYRFTWERKNFKAKEATYRIAASVYGDHVGKSLPFLKVPEQWERDYKRMRSRNENWALVANFLFVPLLIAALFVVIPRIRQRQVTWKPMLWIGGFVGFITVVANLNFVSLFSEAFATSVSYPGQIVILVLSSLIGGLFFMLLIALLAASGDAVYRESAPDKVALARLFTLSGLRTKEFFIATVVGYSLAAFQVGLVVVFYLVARRFGAWSPADIKYDDFLNTALPWIYPMTVGLQAATFEEFAFRLFAVPFLKKYLKSTWLAVLIPAVVWGFLHTTYPQQPAWIRGVEVSVVGIILGYVLLRFGILATLVAHYTFNAAVISLLLLRSNNLYFLLSGGLVMDAMLIPLAIAGALYWQHRGFAAQPELFNAAPAPAPARAVEIAPPEPAPSPTPAAAAAVTETEYARQSRRRLALLAAAGLVGVGLSWFVPAESPLEFGRWERSASQAAGIANGHLQQRGINPAEWRSSINRETHFQSDSAEYVRRQAGIEKVEQLWSSKLSLATASWRVRYFRPLQKEEFVVYVAPDGRVARDEHLLDEKAPGANLTQQEATQRASSYVAQTFQVDVSGWKLAEGKLEKREARTDHHFIWEYPQAEVSEAFLRSEVDVRGDEVTGYRQLLKVPEAWLRELHKPSVQIMVGGLGIILLVIWVLFVSIRLLPQHTFHWRFYITAALLVAGVNLLTHVNGLQAFGSDYDTSLSWTTYLFRYVGRTAFATLGIGVLALLLAFLADLYYGRHLPPALVPSRKSGAGRHYYRDGVVVGVAAALAYQGAMQVARYGGEWLQVRRSGVSTHFGSSLNAYLPGLSSGIDSALGALLSLAILAIAAGTLRRYSTLGRTILLMTGMVLFALPGAFGPREFFYLLIRIILSLGLLALAARYVMRHNLLAYLVTFTFLSLDSDVLYYWKQPAQPIWASAPVAILVACVVIWGALVFLRRVEAPKVVASCQSPVAGG